MTAAVKKELKGLIERCTFKLVVFVDASDKNVHPTKFILGIKHEDETESYKDRLYALEVIGTR